MPVYELSNRVQNFLRHSASRYYKLTPAHKLLLITLSRYRGNQGIFPAVETLAEEMGVCTKSVRRYLYYLYQIKLITIIFRSGYSNEYILNIPTQDELGMMEDEEEVSTSYRRLRGAQHQSRFLHNDGQFETKVIHNPGQLFQGTLDKCSRRPLEHLGVDKIENKVTNKVERGALPNSSNLMPIDEIKPNNENDVLIEQNLSTEEREREIQKFKSYYASKKLSPEGWQSLLNRWIWRAIEYKENKCNAKRVEKPKNETHCTVPLFEPKPFEGKRAAPTSDFKEVMRKLRADTSSLKKKNSFQVGSV